jgi:hypothetical protein
MMVNDIRPEATALLRQIAGVSKNQGSRVEGLKPGFKTYETEFKTQATGLKAHAAINHTQAAQLTRPVMSPADGGVSVVEKVFNQIYSSSGFLEEQEVVPAKIVQLGTQLDVYA